MIEENGDWFDIHQQNVDAWELKNMLDRPSNICCYCNVEGMEEFDWDYAGKDVDIYDYIL